MAILCFVVILLSHILGGCTKPTPISTPAPVPTPTPISTTKAKSVILIDPTNDLFDKSGNPIKDQHYLDIVETEVTTYGSGYLVRIKLNGPPPTKTPEPQIFLEWLSTWILTTTLQPEGHGHLLRMT